MKKSFFGKILVAMLACVLAVCLLGVAACKKGEEHHHDYVESVTKQPTCSSEGEKTLTCACGDVRTEVLKKTPHDFSKYQSNDTQHWIVCSVCGAEDAATGRQNHNHATVVSKQEATCSASGSEVKSCVCGHQETTVLPQTEHDFSKYQRNDAQHWLVCSVCGAEDAATGRQNHNHAISVSKQEATCSASGSEVKSCVCGHQETTVLPQTEHDFSKYQSNDTQHWLVCIWCGLESPNGQKVGHVLTEKVTQEATCSQVGIKTYSCDCGYSKPEEIPKTDHYFVVPEQDAHVEGDCMHKGYDVDVCYYCGVEKKLYDDDFGPHSIVYHEEQPATETYGGNRNYWECTICHKYFSSKNCQTELTAEEVFWGLPQTRIISMDELYETVLQMAADDDFGPTKDFYQLTVTVWEVYAETNSLALWDGTSTFGSDDYWIVKFPEAVAMVAYDATTYQEVRLINDGDVITFKGNLVVDDDDCFITNITVISVDDGNADTFSVVLEDVEDAVNYIWGDGSVTYYDGNAYYNAAASGERISFYYYDWANGSVLQSVTINGVLYSLDQLGAVQKVDDYNQAYLEFYVTVTEDVKISFNFDVLERFTELDYINTTQDGIVINYNNYLTYTFTGQANDYSGNRIYANSAVEFVFTGAHLTKVVIEFDNHNADKLAQNTISAGTDKLHAATVNYSVNALKTTILFDDEADVHFFKYFATACQARIITITFYYTVD